ncbi:MAG TPA: haloacid dehalogenase type II [Terriglobales bacterium]|jgi:2-haloacid dehalogenase|nr:haloacid dehalogenase type II [Terriglobales bacterium]
MDFSRFTALSFDCYGTLIDWEAGILPALRAVLRNHGIKMSDPAILELYGELEAAAESGTYQSYRKVLESVVRGFAARFDFAASTDEIRSLGESVGEWPAFADTVAALRALQERYKLVVISNIDDDLFKATRRRLGVEFAEVITAQQAGSYKPSLNNFRMALERVGIGAEQWLHAGQSVYHDVVPARALGISTVWVNRRSARPGIGAVRAAEGRADFEVADLAGLAAAAFSG